MYKGIVKTLDNPIMCMCDGCGKESVTKIALRDNQDKTIIFQFCSPECANWFRQEGFNDNIVIYFDYNSKYKMVVSN